MNPFVIVTRQRSGSMLLVDILNSHPDIAVLREPFIGRRKVNNPLDETGRALRYFEYTDRDESQRPWVTFKYLRHLTDSIGPVRAGGFKLMYNQIRSCPELIAGFVYRRFRIIHLERDNGLDILLSEEAKNRSNIGHTKESVKAEPVELDPDTIEKQLEGKRRQLRNARAMIGAIPCPTFTVRYEDLVDSSSEKIERISQFLGVDPGGVEFGSQFKKLATGTYRDRIVNYDEIREALVGTRFESVIDT